MNKIKSFVEPNSPITEAYRNIRTNLEFSNVDKNIKVIEITSSIQNEGKTTACANLGVCFAKLENKKVLILDADLRNPSVHRKFEVSNTMGLTDILTGNKGLDICIQQTKIDGLHILTTGKIPPNPSEMLDSRSMRELVNSLREYYDYILIDTPPVGIVTDASIVSTYSDGVVMVVAAKEVDIDMAKMAKERLDKVNANILGAILNKYTNDNGGYGYYNYYYEQYAKGKKKKK